MVDIIPNNNDKKTRLSAEIVAGLTERGLTLTTAESCTGGLVGALITAVPGASDVYPGGVISYTNAVKTALLGIPDDGLTQYGAVSEWTALLMAQGARRLLGADIAVSTTGLAGPGTDGINPVGTVYIGLCDGVRSAARRFDLTGGRDEIRQNAANLALNIINEYLKGNAFND